MSVEVLGDMPKVIGFEQESIIQVLTLNFSFMNLVIIKFKNLIILLIIKKKKYLC